MAARKKPESKINPKDTVKTIINSIKEVAKSSEISQEHVLEIFRNAIEFIITRKIDPDAQIEIEAKIDDLIFKVFNKNGVVVEDSYFEELKTDEERFIESFSFISVTDAKRINSEAKVDETCKIEINIANFDQWLFMAIMHSFKQKISEVIRNNIYNKYLPLKDQIVMATITNKINSGYIFEIDEDKVPAFMPSHYAVNQKLKIGDKLEVVIEDVVKDTRQSQIVISSKSVQLVKKKIIDAIPELQSKHLEIVSIARNPGEKCKVAVRKTATEGADDISEVGSIVGETGSRIFAISQELNGEKVEVIKYDEDPAKFIVNALAPARVICIKEFRISHKLRRYTVVVPDFQHSLAIGKGGSNVKLTADLTRTQLQILPHSAALKDENFEIEWNGNIRDTNELIELKNEYLERQQSRAYSFSSYQNSGNSDSFSSILRQFESDLAKIHQSSSNKNDGRQRDFNRDARLAKKPRRAGRNWQDQGKSGDFSGYYQDFEGGSSSQNSDQNGFFDADSLFSSALNESIIENERIDKQHQLAAQQKSQQPKKTPEKPEQNKEITPPQTNNFPPNESQIRNFKSDDDLINYAGVNDIDFDDFDF